MGKYVKKRQILKFTSQQIKEKRRQCLTFVATKEVFVKTKRMVIRLTLLLLYMLLTHSVIFYKIIRIYEPSRMKYYLHFIKK